MKVRGIIIRWFQFFCLFCQPVVAQNPQYADTSRALVKLCQYLFYFQVLIGVTSSGKPLRGFNAKELLPAECLSSLVGLLSESNVKASLQSKAVVLLFNLGEY